MKCRISDAAMHEKIKNGLTAVDSVKVEEIFLYWIGMAEVCTVYSRPETAIMFFTLQLL